VSEYVVSAASRKVIEQTFARIFAGIMIRSGESTNTKERERKMIEEKKMAVVEPFLYNLT